MSTPRSAVEAPPPPPDAKDVPWWGALILAILTSLVSVIATIYYLRGSALAVPGAPPGLGLIFTDAITFLPHILILFGVFADIFTLQGAYSIPSLIGLLSIPLHYVFQFLWSGVAAFIGDIMKLIATVPAGESGKSIKFPNFFKKKEPAVPSTPLFSGTNTGASVGSTGRPRTFDEDVKTLLGGMRGGAMSAWNGCEVYGFQSLQSPYAPQGLVVTATIFWYYLLDLSMNRNPLDTIATALAFPLFFGLQIWQLSSCEKFSESVAAKSAIALVEGLIIGGTGFGIIQSSIPDRLPSSVLPTVPRLSSMTKNPDGSYTDSDGNEYVIGPDGRPISKKFLAQASNPILNSSGGGVGGLGVGVLNGASPTSCPK
jgi:hypothetical protein